MKCKKGAAFSQRISEDQTTKIMIGGHELYVALCRKCLDNKV